jgi:hypothetical protein
MQLTKIRFITSTRIQSVFFQVSVICSDSFRPNLKSVPDILNMPYTFHFKDHSIHTG